jgi:hypothetical protein
MFIYENRALKVGDALHLTYNVRRDQEFYNFYIIDDKIYKRIKKLPTIVYVHSIDKEDPRFIKVKNNKRSEPIEQHFPKELFSIVKVPKMNDVIQWLYSNDWVFPENWAYFKNEITSISYYIHKIFQLHPRAMYLINKNNNFLYNEWNYEEILMFYKILIITLQIKQYTLYTQYNTPTAKKAFVETMLELNPTWHTKDALSVYELNNFGVFDGDYISNADRLKFYKDPSSRIMKAKDNSDQYQEMVRKIKEFEARNTKLKFANDDRFIKELNQEIIDSLELTIFDVMSLEDRNQLLYIFIDKQDRKRYYIKDFEFSFYVSKVQGIVHNDYLEYKDSNKFVEFILSDINVLQSLKFAVNDNFKNFMKGGKL